MRFKGILMLNLDCKFQTYAKNMRLDATLRILNVFVINDSTPPPKILRVHSK